MAKLTEEETKQLDIIKKNKETILLELGDIKLTELKLQERLTQATDFLTKLKEQEKSTVNSLEQKYGQGTINIDTGEFIPL
jgi:hypothetical protein|tara:strand:+ start:143 stop:385 length:243 start_codon:yes stop_codon:yes gene_type:complete